MMWRIKMAGWCIRCRTSSPAQVVWRSWLNKCTECWITKCGIRYSFSPPFVYVDGGEFGSHRFGYTIIREAGHVYWACVADMHPATPCSAATLREGQKRSSSREPWCIRHMYSSSSSPCSIRMCSGSRKCGSLAIASTWYECCRT